MGLAYVLDPCIQHQNRAGVNNVHGFFKVYLDNTDDAAVTYKDFAGTLNEERIDIDNNGRCVIIADAEHSYRVEMYAPNGDLLFTQYPVWPLSTGGGGMDAISLESTDGSISVQKTSAGGVVSYDLAVNRTDDPEFLEWVKCSGSSYTDGVYVPHYSSGTMEVGSRGLNLTAGMYYHVTAVIQANKSGVTPYYDNVLTTFSLFDGENTTQVESFTNILDHSLGLSQNYSVSLDVEVGEHDSQLVITIGGALEGTTFSIVSIDAHRIYSGVPKIPDGVARKSWVESNYTATADLAPVALSNSYDDLSDKPTIPAAQMNSDWNASSGVAEILNKPDLSVYATTSEMTTALAGKQDVISDLSTIRSGAAAGATAVQPGSLAVVATTGSYADLSNKPSIPVIGRIIV